MNKGLTTGLRKGANKGYTKGVLGGTMKGLYTPKNNWKAPYVTKGLICLIDLSNQNYIGQTIIPDTSIDPTGISRGTNYGTLFNTSGYKVKKEEGSVDFNRTTGYVRILNSSQVFNSFSSPFTTGSWFKVASSATPQCLLGSYNCNSALQILVLTNGTVRFSVRDSGGNSLFPTSTSTYTDGKWYYVVGVRSGNTCRLYIDGSLIISSSGTLSNLNLSTASLFFGTFNTNACPAINGGSEFPVNGSVGRFEYYNRALTATEINQNYLATRNRYNSIKIK